MANKYSLLNSSVTGGINIFRGDRTETNFHDLKIFAVLLGGLMVDSNEKENETITFREYFEDR